MEGKKKAAGGVRLSTLDSHVSRVEDAIPASIVPLCQKVSTRLPSFGKKQFRPAPTHLWTEEVVFSLLEADRVPFLESVTFVQNRVLGNSTANCIFLGSDGERSPLLRLPGVKICSIDEYRRRFPSVEEERNR